MMKERQVIKTGSQKSSPGTQEQDSMATLMGLSSPRAGELEAGNYQLYMGRTWEEGSGVLPEREERAHKGGEQEGQNARTRH